MSTKEHRLPAGLRRLIDGTGRTPQAMRSRYLASLSASPAEWNVSMPSRGLGDTIAKLTTKLGIKPCGGCKRRQKALNRLVPFPSRRVARAAGSRNGKHLGSLAGTFKYRGVTPEFVTYARRQADIDRLALMLPPDTAAIVGISRSGLPAATDISMRLQKPLFVLRQHRGDIIEADCGFRLKGVPVRSGPVVLVDDICLSGNSVAGGRPVVERTFPGHPVVTAALYVNANARTKPDIAVNVLQWPILLEWNFANSVMANLFAVDFDGVLCDDQHWNDPANAEPRYLFRRAPIPLIVTGRPEAQRSVSVAWLARYGMSAERLEMWPGDGRGRTPEAVAAFKADRYKRWASLPHRMQPAMFVESDPWQAERIAQLSDGVVVCPSIAKCFRRS